MARKILLADDSVTAQNMGRKILADAGYEVITVNNGSAALKRVAEQRPDLIVLDVYMPGYSGLEVCQRLKEAGDTAQIPVLLTVGKLEPFKPEEAKRVRADAFIVKPFEASELLSALSKLEDKVVPRSESSKPGRFARSSRSLDDSRYDKTMAVEEDTSWKNRIAFPSKKKSEEPSEVEDPAVFGRVNKDIRPAAQPPAEMQVVKASVVNAEEERVDLGALSAAGLPKDVTPEEIAALAAAAARVKSAKESAAEMPVVAPTEAESPKPEIQTAPAAESTPVVTPVVAVAATEEQIEPKPATIEPEPVSVSQADAVPAVAEQQPLPAEEPVTTAQSGSSSATPVNEPVTMAMAAAASASSAPSRWTAVSVAVAPEDAAISLEQEMQKAYAAFAAAESAHNLDMSSSAAGNGNGAVAEISVPEPAISVPATAAPVVAQAMSEVAAAATDAVRAAVQELESVAASYVAAASESTNAVAAQPEVEPAKTEEEKTPEPVNGKSSAFEEAAAAQAAAAPEVSAPSSEASPVPSHEASVSPAIPALPSANATASQDETAMAVAAGAEASPSEPAAESESESDVDPIASIVDSVLADLRPKIVAEISKKLGKRK